MSANETRGHTPGPWEVHKNFPNAVVPAGQSERHIGGSTYEDHDREQFARVIAEPRSTGTYPHDISDAEARANARLIAAAPELAEALERLYTLGMNCEARGVFKGAWAGLWDTALRKASAALEKSDPQRADTARARGDK